MVLDRSGGPCRRLATAIYTLYWLINDTKQSDTETKCNELVIDYSANDRLFVLNIRVYLAMFIGIIAYFLFFPAYRLKLPCKD